MPDRVVVRVPATIANLGPGFDCIGMAIAWYNELRVERSASDDITITATGPGADLLPRDRSNLAIRAMEEAGPAVRGLSVNQIVGIAPGRGFGSSAAAICGGLVAARALDGKEQGDLLALAVELEGHADNVAPCLLGGIVVSAAGRSIKLSPPAGLRPLIMVSPTRLGTDVARAALGDQVARTDATAALGRAALLATTLATGELDAVFDATEDSFHQPARFELMPDSAQLVRALRVKGVAAFLAGAGPSVAALVPRDEASAVEALARSVAPDAWDVRLEEFDDQGARVVDTR